MTLTLNGTSGVTTPGIANSEGYTGDGLTIAAGAPAGALQIDSAGNAGLGAVPSAWNAGKALQLTGTGLSGSLFMSDSGVLMLSNNYRKSDGDVYVSNGIATRYYQYAGQHIWNTAPSGTAGNPITFTQAMTLNASGNLLVGYTTSNGSYKLQVNSQIFATSSTIATSDAKYKTNVVPLKGNALSLVDALNPVQFTWKQHPVHDFNTDIPTIGFLAQEVQDVLKDTAYVNSVVKESECELPDGTKEKFLGIAEGNLIAILTAAIQEQQAMITELKARIEQLEAK